MERRYWHSYLYNYNSFQIVIIIYLYSFANQAGNEVGHRLQRGEGKKEDGVSH